MTKHAREILPGEAGVNGAAPASLSPLAGRDGVRDSKRFRPIRGFLQGPRKS